MRRKASLFDQLSIFFNAKRDAALPYNEEIKQDIEDQTTGWKR